MRVHLIKIMLKAARQTNVPSKDQWIKIEDIFIMEYNDLLIETTRTTNGQNVGKKCKLPEK